jgi:hypothetical protein
MVSCTLSLLLLSSALVGLAQADSLDVRFVGGCDTPGMAMDVAVSGDFAYVADHFGGLRVISVADPTRPDTVGHCDSLGRVWGVAVSDDYVYVASGDSGLWVLSTVDPAHPTKTGHCPTQGQALSLTVVGDFAYVADGGSGLRVISVADPANPVDVGSCGTPGQANAVAVVDSFAYVADDTAGLRVVSIADPAHPTEVGFCHTPGMALGVAVSGGYAYVAGYEGGLRVISVNDPTHPVEVGFAGPIFALGVTVKGYHAFVAADVGGLRVISVADPARPTVAGYYDTPGHANAVSVSRHYAYIADGDAGLQILQYYGGALGDLDVDPDSLDVAADTITLRVSSEPGPYSDFALGEFVLANTSTSYNPDTTDGPSTSPVESLLSTGSLTGPRGTLDSILIPNLPGSLAQSQAVVCTLAVYAPGSLSMGEYSGQIVITGFDSLQHQTADTVYALLRSFGDIDVDDDSLDVIADTIRLRPRLASAGPPPKYTEYALGRFVLANTDTLHNPDATDGPSLSPVDSLSFTGSLIGPGGTLDSILIPNLPDSLAQGQAVVCTLAVYMPFGFHDGDYVGSITITGKDSAGMSVNETFNALIKKNTLGDLDVDDESLDVTHDTMELYTQPAGPVYHPYAKAEFMLVNTYEFYNPDTADGPSRSPLREVKVEARVEGQNGSIDRVYVFNLPESLAVGQAVECTLASVLPVGATPDGYSGWITVSAVDTLGYQVQDSFAIAVRGPQPRQNLDSLRVAPIPFKPNQNPEHDAIHFQGLTAGARVNVYDASGQSVWTATESGDGHLKWDAKVASGIYVYLVVAKDGQSKVGKLSVIR